MAKHSEHRCLTCGQTFEYCRRCAITPVIYKMEGFCSENCSNIFKILSKHGCNLASADETLTELATYNLDEIKLTKDIRAHIETLESEVAIKSEAEMPIDETIIQSDEE